MTIANPIFPNCESRTGTRFAWRLYRYHSGLCWCTDILLWLNDVVLTLLIAGGKENRFLGGVLNQRCTGSHTSTELADGSTWWKTAIRDLVLTLLTRRGQLQTLLQNAGPSCSPPLTFSTFPFPPRRDVTGLPQLHVNWKPCEQMEAVSGY